MSQKQTAEAVSRRSFIRSAADDARPTLAPPGCSRSEAGAAALVRETLILVVSLPRLGRIRI